MQSIWKKCYGYLKFQVERLLNHPKDTETRKNIVEKEVRMSNVIDIRTKKVIEVVPLNYKTMDLVGLMKEMIQFKNELTASGRITKEQAIKGLPLLEALIEKSNDPALKAYATLCYTEMLKISKK